MPTSVSRGPITFEDGSTFEDVEVFDDGTWVNHGLRQREAAYIIRASTDKARREIKIPSRGNCTVLGVELAQGVAGGVATVHVDGNPTIDTQQVTISAAYTPRPGGRAQLEFTPPHGASIVAPIGQASGDPTGGINTECGGGGLQFYAVAESALHVFCCEEFVTGGVSTDGGSLLRVPASGIYSVSYMADAVLIDTGSSVGGPFMYVKFTVVATDTDGVEKHVGSCSLPSPIFAHSSAVHRAAVPLTAGTVLSVLVANATDFDLQLPIGRLDCAWQTAHDGTSFVCATPPC